MIVLDASLAVKLVLREDDSDAALDWYARVGGELAAPELIAIEVAQAIVRRVNMPVVTAANGRGAFRTWQAFCGDAISLTHISPHRLEAAVDIAMSLGHPVKDCIYLALSIEQGCEFMTCDAKFAVKARALYPNVKLLADYGD